MFQVAEGHQVTEVNGTATLLRFCSDHVLVLHGVHVPGAFRFEFSIIFRRLPEHQDWSELVLAALVCAPWRTMKNLHVLQEPHCLGAVAVWVSPTLAKQQLP